MWELTSGDDIKNMKTSRNRTRGYLSFPTRYFLWQTDIYSKNWEDELFRTSCTAGTISSCKITYSTIKEFCIWLETPVIFVIMTGVSSHIQNSLIVEYVTLHDDILYNIDIIIFCNRKLRKRERGKELSERERRELAASGPSYRREREKCALYINQ